MCYLNLFVFIEAIFEPPLTSKSRQNLGTKNFTNTKKFYLHKIAAVNLSKIYFLKNAMKTCKPHNRDLNRDWINHKFIVKTRVLDPYIVHVGTNDSPLHKKNLWNPWWYCKCSRITEIWTKNCCDISHRTRSNNFEEKIIEVNELLALKCREKGIPTIMTVLIVLFL